MYATRFSGLGQVLPPDFDKMSPEEKVKYIDNLPPDKKEAALAELLRKLPLELQMDVVNVWKNSGRYKADLQMMGAFTIGSFLYDSFVTVPSESATKGKRTAAYVGSSVISGAAAYQAFRVMDSPLAGSFTRILAAFIGVFTSVDALLRIISIVKNEKTSQSPVLSPKTSLAVAVSGKR